MAHGCGALKERELLQAGVLVNTWPSVTSMLSQQTAHRYHPGEIYVTENGVDVPNENSLSLADALNDTFRVNFYQGYVQAAQQAVIDGVPLKGYFAWSLLGAPFVC